MQEHKFSAGSVKKENAFILRIVFTEDITVAHLLEIKKIREQLFGEEKFCTLIDATKDFMGITKEAQEYIASNPTLNKRRIAEAILVKNFGQKLGVQMYIRIFKPKKMTVVFYKEAAALAWLKEQYDTFVAEGK